MHPETDDMLYYSRRIKEYCSIYSHNPHKCIFCKYSNNGYNGQEVLLCTHWNGICRGKWKEMMEKNNCKLRDFFN